jgi:hypothetical protein
MIAESRIVAVSEVGEIHRIRNFLGHQRAANEAAKAPLQAIGDQGCGRNTPGSKSEQVPPFGTHPRWPQPAPQAEPAAAHGLAVATVALDVVALVADADAQHATQLIVGYALTGK